ncbi:MAG: PHP domain-containing protein [Bacillota bacterium]
MHKNMILKISVNLTIICLLLIFASVAEAQNEKYDGSLFIVAPDELRFEPSAAFWSVSFSLISLSDMQTNPILKSVVFDGVDISKALTDLPTVLPVNKARDITMEQILRWHELRKQNATGIITSTDLTELGKLDELIKKAIASPAGSVELKIHPSEIPIVIEKDTTYPLQIELQNNRGMHTFSTHMMIQALPTDSKWVPVQLHVHSIFSDGRRTPLEIANIYKNMGYKAIYITDHLDKLPDWTIYRKSIADAANQSGISVFPGTEIAVGVSKEKGHLLAYGIVNLTGLENQPHEPQQCINNVLRNSGQSSSAIAHPDSMPSWTDWTVTKYSGFELMSGKLQIFFDEKTRPVVRWRSELMRLLSETFGQIWRPSARAGDDWHSGQWYDPNPVGYVTYLMTSGSTNKSAIDSALLRGKSVASKHGSLAYFRFKWKGKTVSTGEALKGVPAGSIINTDITFKPLISGKYTINIYRDDLIKFNSTPKSSLLCRWISRGVVYKRSGIYNNKSTYNFSANIFAPFGRHYYYLYISGEDHIYSTPIFLSN